MPSLTTLPPELILGICNHLPLLAIGNLSRTSRQFFNAVGPLKDHCNRIIRTRYAIEAGFLGTEMKDGWLLPSAENLQKLRGFWFLELLSITRGIFKKIKAIHDRVHHLTAASYELLLQPGPYYALFLTRYSSLLHENRDRMIECKDYQNLDQLYRAIMECSTKEGWITVVYGWDTFATTEDQVVMMEMMEFTASLVYWRGRKALVSITGKEYAWV